MSKKVTPKKELLSTPGKAKAAAPKTELAVTETKPKALAAVQGLSSEFFDENEMTDSADMLIPKLLLMQGPSEYVAEGKAAMGDIVNSVTAEVLGNKTKVIEVIPLKERSKTWVIEQWNGSKFEFVRQEPWTPANKDAPWEFEEEGAKMRRNQSLNFFVLLARDADNAAALPYEITFRRTSYNEGRKLHSHFDACKMAFRRGDSNAIPMNAVFELACAMQKGDKGPYYVWELRGNPGQGVRRAKDAEKQVAVQWFQTLRTADIRVDDRDLREMDVESNVAAPISTELDESSQY